MITSNTSSALALNASADSVVAEFDARYAMPGCSIERAALVSTAAPREAFRLARAKQVAYIEAGWGREAADRWDTSLRAIWG